MSAVIKNEHKEPWIAPRFVCLHASTSISINLPLLIMKLCFKHHQILKSLFVHLVEALILQKTSIKLKCSLYLLRSPLCLRVNSDIIAQTLDSFFCALSLLTHISALSLYFSMPVSTCRIACLPKKCFFRTVFQDCINWKDLFIQAIKALLCCFPHSAVIIFITQRLWQTCHIIEKCTLTHPQTFLWLLSHPFMQMCPVCYPFMSRKSNQMQAFSPHCTLWKAWP